MDDVDPTAAASLDDLAACLRYVHLLADQPAYRALEQQTARENGFLPGTRLRRVRLTRTTVSDVLTGRKFPGKAFLLTFVDACGVDLENDLRWEQAWDRLAILYQQAPPPGEAERLRQENEELRQQLTAAKDQAAAAESRRADQQQTRVQTVQSRLDMAIRRARAAEGLLELERGLSGSRFASVTMPQLGEALTEGTVTRWLKTEGDYVEAGAALLEISTGDGHAEIRAPVKGTVRAVLQDKIVTPGTVLAVIDEALEILVARVPVPMPQLGESVTEGTVTRWLKKEGERVEEDEPLLEVSTDKVDTEIPAPASGIVREIAVHEAETVAVGTQLAVIEDARSAGRQPSADLADLGSIRILRPITYREARMIGEHFRQGAAVVISAGAMSNSEARRLLDFAAGLTFASRGSFERLTNAPVFLLCPPNMKVTPEDKARLAERCGRENSAPARKDTGSPPETPAKALTIYPPPVSDRPHPASWLRRRPEKR